MATAHDNTVSAQENLPDCRHLEQQLHQMESRLKTFQSKVKTKMDLIEHFFAMKLEQLNFQKQLFDQEYSLYDTIVSQWKNMVMVDPTSQEGGSISYSNAIPVFHTQSQDSSASHSLGKRVSTSSAVVPDNSNSRKRLIAKRRRTNDTVEMDMDSSHDNEITHHNLDVDPLVDDSIGIYSDAETDDQDITGDGDDDKAKRNTFIAAFPAEAGNTDEGSFDPLWNHFLQSENGTILMCKHCHEKGFQKIYKLTPTTGKTVARNHLRVKHKIHIEPPLAEVDGEQSFQSKDIASEKGSGCRRKTTFLRHNNYLYQLRDKRNSVTYWRCREYNTCNGKVIRRDGVIRETIEHSCLTTAADCDAYELREKLKDLAEDHPLLSPNDIIASAKEGYSDEVLQLLPDDEALRRTVLRIRKALLALSSS